MSECDEIACGPVQDGYHLFVQCIHAVYAIHTLSLCNSSQEV